MQVTSNATDTAPALDPTIVTLDVSGMKCAGCVKAVEDQLLQQSGVLSATVNLVTEVATVECQPDTNPTVLATRLTEAGFPSQPRLSAASAAESSNSEDWAERRQLELRQQVRRVAIAALLLGLSTIGHLDHFHWVRIPVLSNIWFHFGLATLALCFPGRSILVEGWQGLRRNAPNMNTLVGLGTFTAYSTSTIALLFPQLGWECFFDEPVMLVSFILLGRTLEQQARNRAATALQSLVALKPNLARLIQPVDAAIGSTSLLTIQPTEIPVDQVQVGTWLQVLPGDQIPVDGEVVAGQTTVNEAMLTGESMPVLKQPGDAVAAGSLNQSGAIAIQATRIGKDTTLAQIINLVETAQTRRAPIQRLADLVAGYFTYGVMAIAFLTFVFWYFVGISLFPGVLHTGHGAGHSLMAAAEQVTVLPYASLLLSLKLAIAVLVVACPCALGLATPTAILVGSGIGAEKGLLIRGGDVLEKMHRITTVVLDKTGTLTTGNPIVTDCLPEPGTSATELLQFAATVESGTRHPIATAIQQFAQQQELPLLPAQDFYTKPGLGVSANVAGRSIAIGTVEWLAQHEIVLPDSAQATAQQWIDQGKTVVFVGINQQFAGIVAVQDAVRADAQSTIAALRQMGLRVIMLTGDHPVAAAAIAKILGLAAEDVLANVRPDGKAAAIAQLQSQGQQVVMIGDGINDAPALAQADVSMALHSSTSVAIETAEIVLMRDRLSDSTAAIRLSQQTFVKIQQNLFWAFAYNLIGIPIAAGALLPSSGILLSPATAGAFMAFSSVSVVTNSLLLRRTCDNL